MNEYDRVYQALSRIYVKNRYTYMMGGIPLDQNLQIKLGVSANKKNSELEKIEFSL